MDGAPVRWNSVNRQMFVDESEESSKILVVTGVMFNHDAVGPFFKEWRKILRWSRKIGQVAKVYSTD